MLLQDSEEGDYDPEKDEPGSADDEELSEEEDTGPGPSSSKRPKLDTPQKEESDCSDSD